MLASVGFARSWSKPAWSRCQVVMMSLLPVARSHDEGVAAGRREFERYRLESLYAESENSSVAAVMVAKRQVAAARVRSGARVEFFLDDARREVPRRSTHSIGPLKLPRRPAGRDDQSQLEVGGWCLGACVGRGANGRVYEATHTLFRRVAVVKMIELMGDQEVEGRFEREARALWDLRHPGVPALYGAGRTDSRAIGYLVQEHLVGCDLSALLKVSYRFTDADLALIADGVAGALAAAHAIGIVHRDIKPSNVFLAEGASEDARFVCLLDFGCASIVDAAALTRAAAAVGTRAYVPPEAFSRKVDASADIWSLGLTLYVLATGTNPFEQETSEETMQAILHGTVPTLDPEAFPRTAQVCERALRRTREERPTAQEVRDLLATNG